MPVAQVYLYGNLPVDIEFDGMWIPLQASVLTNTGVKFLDMTDGELFALCDKNAATLKEQLEQSGRDNRQQVKCDAKKFRDDGCFQAAEY